MLLPGEKRSPLFDTEGPFLIITPTGSKLWRWKFRGNGVEKRISLGSDPKVSLKAARDTRDEYQADLRKGVAPSAARKRDKLQAQSCEETFERLAEEWFTRFKHTWTEHTAETISSRLRKDIFPYIGARPIREITAPELLAVIRRIASRGAVDTARRDMQKCGQIFRYAVVTGRAERDVASDLQGAIAPPKKRHFASIHEPKEIGALLRAIDGYQGSLITRSALKLAPLTFVRPGELRHAEWSEINLDAAEWRIPAARMKMREKHIVPLSRQAVEVLRDLHPITGSRQYVFTGERAVTRPMSENTVVAALRRLGYEKGEMTGHGFRSMASTVLHELGWPSEVIERQLAHGDRNKIRAAYNFAQHVPKRKHTMQPGPITWTPCVKAGRSSPSSRPASSDLARKRLQAPNAITCNTGQHHVRACVWWP